MCFLAYQHQPAARQKSPWILSAVRRGRATAGKEVLREALLARLEDPRYLDSLVMRAAEKRLHHVKSAFALLSVHTHKVFSNVFHQGKMDEHIFRDIARVREVMAAFLDSASSSRLAAKLDRAGIDDAERIAMEMSGEGTRLDRVLDGIPDGVLLDLVGAVLDNLGQTLEELIDYIASAVDGAVDNLFSEGGDALDQVLEDLGEDVMDLLELFKKSGYYGIPAQFNEDTRQALIDLRVGSVLSDVLSRPSLSTSFPVSRTTFTSLSSLWPPALLCTAPCRSGTA